VCSKKCKQCISEDDCLECAPLRINPTYCICKEGFFEENEVCKGNMDIV
jgi:hypothetical protein